MSVTPMSVTGSEASCSGVAAAEVLAYDQQQLLDYVKTKERGADGAVNFSQNELVGLGSLSKSQRIELFDRITHAMNALQAPQPFHPDELDARLQELSSIQEPEEQPPDSIQMSERARRSPTEVPEEEPPGSVKKPQIASLQELIRDGGRPACSIEELRNVLAAPMDRYHAVLPWLTDHPDTQDGDGDLKTIFERQWSRWWEFRKFQWYMRGLDDEPAVAAYIATDRRKEEAIGKARWLSSPRFDETSRRMWEHTRVPKKLPEEQTFTAYSNAVKRRLAPYHFTPALRLSKDPQKQNAWTNWLEYISFEARTLEDLTVAAQSWEPEFHESMRKLWRVRYPKVNCDVIFDFTLGINIVEQRPTAPDNPDAYRNAIHDFIRGTDAFMRRFRAAYYQRHGVKWAVKEARLMEKEMALQRTEKSKKRKKPSDELPEPRTKRTRQADSGKGADPVTIPAESGLRRSARLRVRPKTRMPT